MDKCCGLDIHKDSIFACVLDEKGKIVFGLPDTMVSHGCGQAVWILQAD